MNKNLKKQIEQAKQKTMNFVIVGTASKPSKLLLSNKKIPDSAVKEAKEEFGGNAVLRGIVNGEGSTLTFQSVDKSGFDEGKLKKLIKEEADVTVSVAFKQSDDVEEVDEKETPGSKAPASKELGNLIERFGSLKETIVKATKDHATWADSILKLAKKAQRALDEEDEGPANEALVELENMIESLDREAKSKGPAPTTDIAKAEKQRKDYIDRMQPRYEVLMYSKKTAYNLDGFFERLTLLEGKWDNLNREAVLKPEDIAKSATREKEFETAFQELVNIPEKATKAKRILVTSILGRIETLLSDFDIVKNAKHEVNGKTVNVVDDGEYSKTLDKWRNADPEGWTSATKFNEATTALGELEKKMKGYLSAVEAVRREALKNGKMVMKFDGDEMKEDKLKEKIASILPDNGKGNINQSLNDVLLGRGKATTGFPDVLHASAGKPGAAGGCTLFFKRDKDGNVDVVGIGQHSASASYNIYHGLGLKGKQLSL